MAKSKTEDAAYETIRPPEGWSPGDPPVVIERPWIKVNFAGRPARTFGRLLLVSGITVSVLALIYMLIAGLVSAPGYLGEKQVSVPDRDDFGDPLAFYPWLVIIMAAAYVIAICIWFFNKDD